MNKSILILLVVVAALVVALVYCLGREKRPSLTFRGPSGKMTTFTVK